MFKLAISIILLSSNFLIVLSENVPRSAENVVVTIRDALKPQHIVAALNKDNQSDSGKDSANRNVGAGFARTARAKTSSSIKEMFSCAIALDAPCLVDRVEDIVDNANVNLLQQADVEARRMSAGRADTSASSEEEPSPSSLIQSIARLVLEIPGLVGDSIGGMIRSGNTELDGSTSESEESDEDDSDDADDEDEEDEDSKEEVEDDKENNDDEAIGETEDDEQAADVVDDTVIESKDYVDSNGDVYGLFRKKCGKKKGQMCNVGGSGGGTGFGDKFQGFSYGTTPSGREVGDGRGKKKKKKKKAIAKLLLLGLVLKAKLTLLLKLLATKLQIKFLLIALANLLINLARFWWDLKKGHGNEHPQKVIYYEHAQHQHHYDGGDDWQSSGPAGGGGGGGGYWARAYDDVADEKGELNRKSAQDLAYSKQLPHGTTYSRIDDKPNISWNPWG